MDYRAELNLRNSTQFSRKDEYLLKYIISIFKISKCDGVSTDYTYNTFGNSENNDTLEINEVTLEHERWIYIFRIFLSWGMYAQIRPPGSICF